MLLQQEIIGNSRVGRAHWAEVQRARQMANNHERALRAMAGLTVNEGLIPRDVYQEFDNVTVERFRSDDGDTYLNDLLPLSRSVNIGKLVQRFRKASDAGNTQTSMSGQIGVKMDKVDYTYDGAIVPIHDGGFYRNWREWNAQSSEGFDALIDDQRETVASLRQRMADQFLDGHRDQNGTLLVVDGLSWLGMRADSRVAQIDLSGGGLNFDFTLTTNSGEAIKNAFIAVRNVIWIDNNAELPLTIYVSREIAANFERKFSTQYNAPTITAELQQLQGIAEIKVTSKLTGNQMMGFPLDSNFIRPVVGMGLNTVAMPRPVYNSNYEFVTWAAIGFSVRTDFAGRTSAFYASS